MATFVLVHGAWHGGWCWSRVAARLRAQGHDVFAPTLTGLGERAHLLSPEVGVATHVEDVCAVIRCERLDDVVLVGHSYAGVVLAGVAERLPERLRRLVFLDAVVAGSGESVFSTSPAFEARVRRETPAGAIAAPPLGAAFLGVDDPEDAAWVESLTTPMPLACFEQGVELADPRAAAIPRSYVWCRRFGFADTYARVAALGWDVHDLDTGHDAMVTCPDGVADILASLP